MPPITLSLGLITPRRNYPYNSRLDIQPGVYKACGTNLGYCDPDTAFDSFQCKGGDINEQLLLFKNTFIPEDGLKTKSKNNIIGYRYEPDTQILFIGVREEGETSNKIHEVPIASINPSTKIELSISGNEQWQINVERSNEKTTYILTKQEKRDIVNKSAA